MSDLLQNEHEHTESELRRIYGTSAALRAVGGAAQLIVGIASGTAVLTAEGAEELTDAAFFATMALEEGSSGKTKKRMRNMTLGLVAAASSIATGEVVYEIANEGHEWLTKVEPLNFASAEQKTAALALALSGVVFYLNRGGQHSHDVKQKAGWRDSVKDFILPGGLLLAFGIRAPHIGEFVLEGGGASYGWYNTYKLWKGFKKPHAH
ncbi:MAG: hypothetical protein WCJ60_03095 [bacterium]